MNDFPFIVLMVLVVLSMVGAAVLYWMLFQMLHDEYQEMLRRRDKREGKQ